MLPDLASSCVFDRWELLYVGSVATFVDIIRGSVDFYPLSDESGNDSDDNRSDNWEMSLVRDTIGLRLEDKVSSFQPLWRAPRYVLRGKTHSGLGTRTWELRRWAVDVDSLWLLFRHRPSACGSLTRCYVVSGGHGFDRCIRRGRQTWPRWLALGEFDWAPRSLTACCQFSLLYRVAIG